jgi:hypothetical protein
MINVSGRGVSVRGHQTLGLTGHAIGSGRNHLARGTGEHSDMEDGNNEHGHHEQGEGKNVHSEGGVASPGK